MVVYSGISIWYKLLVVKVVDYERVELLVMTHDLVVGRCAASD